ncbi:MAG: type VI secretion system tube protein Hcp [Phycisphaeraceae bacterium]|nr:MAG: type VI secretion system tube protein Hcp [Phycisphaeraceae bacterium]
MSAFYVTITNSRGQQIKGDVEQEGREETIRGYAFSNRTTIPRHKDTGQPTGNRTHHPIVFSKHVDLSSPLLWEAMTRGETLQKVQFDFYMINKNGENERIYSITLEDAIIVEMQSEKADTAQATGTQAEDMREQLHFTYRTITWEHHGSTHTTSDSWDKS